jgi:RHS repeat-associated protein
MTNFRDLSGDHFSTYNPSGPASVRPHAPLNGYNTAAIGYDANGSMTTKTVTGTNSGIYGLAWDKSGNLASVTKSGGTNDGTTTNLYNADGQRRYRQDPDGTQTWYLGPLELTKPAGITTLTGTRYYAANGAPIALRTVMAISNALTWVTTNNQRSITTTTPNGTSTPSTTSYFPYGTSRARTGTPPTQRGYIGETQDPNILTYLNARYLDPVLGRFISVDPLVGVTRDAYGYAGNNPITFVDPSGLGTSDPKQIAEESNGECGQYKECSSASDAILPGVNTFYDLQSRWAHAVADVGAVPLDPFVRQDGMIACVGLDGCKAALAFLNGVGDHATARDILVAKYLALYSGLASGDLDSSSSFTIGAKYISNGMFFATNFILQALSKGSVPCASFCEDTPVLMADGSLKAISNVRVGDSVLATDPTTKVTTARAVTATMAHDDNDLLDLILETDQGSRVVHTTDHHRIWDGTRASWVLASDLAVGDQLLSSDGSAVTVENRVRVNGHGSMFDLTVSTDHTFYVGAGSESVLVHNQTCDLYHGTDIRSAANIARNGISAARANALGGGDVFWVSADVEAAWIFAEVNPAGGAPGVVGINLQGGVEAAVQSGLLTPVSGLPGAYTVSSWSGFNGSAEFVFLGG